MPKKLLHEKLTQIFSVYAPDDFNEKYHSFMEHYSPEQRLDLQMLHCADVDNLILQMTRINDRDLGKEILASAPEMLQCLFILRYIAVLKFLIHSKDQTLGANNVFSYDEILAGCLLIMWYKYSRYVGLDVWREKDLEASQQVSP